MNKWVVLGLLVVGVGAVIAMSSDEDKPIVREGQLSSAIGVAHWRVREIVGGIGGIAAYFAQMKLPGEGWKELRDDGEIVVEGAIQDAVNRVELVLTILGYTEKETS